MCETNLQGHHCVLNNVVNTSSIFPIIEGKNMSQFQNNTTMPSPKLERWIYTKEDLIIETVCLIILSLCILFGNGLVCMAFATERKLQTTTNCFVVSLACSDIMVGAIVIPLYLIIKHEKIVFSDPLYETWLALEISGCCASIASLVAISIERCLSVKLPAWHRNITRKTVRYVIAFVWFHAIVVSGAFFNVVTTERKKWLPIYRFVMAFFLPLVIIVGAYFLIFNVAISRSKRHTSSFRREIRITVTIGIVIGAFVCSWLPFFVLSIVAAYAHQSVNINWPLAMVLVKWLQYLNSVVNPIIYTYGNQDFRKSFHKLLRCFKINRRERADSRLMSRSRADSRLDSKTEQTTLKSTSV